MRFHRIVPSLLLLAACAPRVEEGAFIERLGNDTLSVEVFSRTPQRLEGQLLTRQPATRLISWDADLDGDGRITALRMRAETPAANPDGRGPMRASVTIRGDTAVVERIDATAETTMVAVPPATIPVVPKNPLPGAFLDYIVGRAAEGQPETFTYHVLPAGGRRVADNAVVFHGVDSATIDFFGSPLLLSLDAGHLQRVSGARTTVKVEVERVAPGTVDLAALAQDFAARDARGEGLGIASPRDTVEARIGPATITVEYSRPAKRGRPIWGGLVPYDTIWRTGANAATHLTTTRPIRLGTLALPAGSYTLWTEFTADGGELIVNRETGIWGTAYDPAHDLGRTALKREPATEPAERFTIALETARGGALALAWDDVVWRVPIVVSR